MIWIRSFFMCLGMFTAIPCPYRPWDEDARPRMTAMLPMVGLVIGAIWLALGLLARAFLPTMVAAGAVAALPILLTGMIHMDGFMDTVDATMSWRDAEERRKILKDVHCGSFAVIASILLCTGQFAAAYELLARDILVLLLLPAASRCLSAIAISILPAISHSEYAKGSKHMDTAIAATAMLVSIVIASFFWLGIRGGIAILAETAAYMLAMAWAVHSLGGVSGDLAGYALCVAELAGMIAAAIL
ncbi:MAG: adenosylcobinamide-GDP ribazoletransferase [Clostridia bacterium]|nr:adenosylcobinamide-GDP ribazoletransferase [Clostridia bacterium]